MSFFYSSSSILSTRIIKYINIVLFSLSGYSLCLSFLFFSLLLFFFSFFIVSRVSFEGKIAIHHHTNFLLSKQYVLLIYICILSCLNHFTFQIEQKKTAYIAKKKNRNTTIIFSARCK